MPLLLTFSQLCHPILGPACLTEAFREPQHGHGSTRLVLREDCHTDLVLSSLLPEKTLTLLQGELFTKLGRDGDLASLSDDGNFGRHSHRESISCKIIMYDAERAQWLFI